MGTPIHSDRWGWHCPGWVPAFFSATHILPRSGSNQSPQICQKMVYIVIQDDSSIQFQHRLVYINMLMYSFLACYGNAAEPLLQQVLHQCHLAPLAEPSHDNPCFRNFVIVCSFEQKPHLYIYMYVLITVNHD